MEKEDQRVRIGRRITELRQLAGMTQEELAEKSGVSRSHISRIERGMYNSRIDILSVIADALDAQVDMNKLYK